MLIIILFILAFVLDWAFGINQNINLAIAPWVISAGIAGIGALGQLMSGGKKEKQTTTQTRELSPEQSSFLQFLQTQLGEKVFDVGDLVRTTRERFGAEATGLRQAALQRLLRSGVPALQRESILSDINTPILREMGSTIADIEFSGKQAEEERRLAIIRQMAALLGGTGRMTGETIITPPSGGGFAQLFGAGLAGLINRPGIGERLPKGKIVENDWLFA